MVEMTASVDIVDEQSRAQLLKEICKDQAHYAALEKVWVSALQMRNWLMVKKNSVSNKYTESDSMEQDQLGHL